MRALGLLLLVGLCLSCPQVIGDRCGEGLPPCPTGTACLDGVCRADQNAAGGTANSGGGTAGGSTSISDAGFDGGSDAGLDGGSDAGAVPDAGDTRDAGRVLRLTSADLYEQEDGGIFEYPRDGESANALFFSVDGGFLRVPMTADGGGAFTLENAPAGPWMAEVTSTAGSKSYFDVSTDEANVSLTVYSGRPGIPVSTSTFIGVDLGLRPWGEFDFIQISSRRAGCRLVFEPLLGLGSTQLSGQLRPTAAFGSRIARGDDVRVSQFTATTLDSGIEVTTIAGTAARSDLQIPGDVVAETLVEPQVNARAKIELDAGFFGGFPGGVGAVTCFVSFSELAGAARVVDAPQIAVVSPVRFSAVDVSFPHPAGTNVVGSHQLGPVEA